MYSEYTTRFTHSIQFMCILYNLYCIVHIDYIYILQIVSYTLILLLHYIHRMCVKNKCAVCAMYSVTYCTYSAPRIYIIYARCAIRPFYLPSQDLRILRALVK